MRRGNIPSPKAMLRQTARMSATFGRRGALLTRRALSAIPGAGVYAPALFSKDATVWSAWLVASSGPQAEVVAAQGCDALVIDCQHGVYTTESMVAMLQAVAAAPAPAPAALVRVSECNAAEITKALDAGAAGLICPMINSALEAEAFVRAARYPPLGRRSFGPYRSALGWSGTPGDLCRKANQEVTLLAMIETSGALNELDAILGTEGLSGVFIGPNDLGLTLGFDPSSSPAGEVLETVEMIVTRAHAAGKKAGVYCADGQTARRMAALGFDLVNVGIDLAWAAQGVAAALKDAKTPA